jgi:hypothetical protein
MQKKEPINYDAYSIERNVRACYPNKSEFELFVLIQKTIESNKESVIILKDKGNQK